MVHKVTCISNIIKILGYNYYRMLRAYLLKGCNFLGPISSTNISSSPVKDSDASSNSSTELSLSAKSTIIWKKNNINNYVWNYWTEFHISSKDWSVPLHVTMVCVRFSQQYMVPPGNGKVERYYSSMMPLSGLATCKGEWLLKARLFLPAAGTESKL